MQKLLRFNYCKTDDQGFSTLEVLVSILAALAFVGFSLQSFVLGLAIRVQAQEKQRANQLIQEDLERLSELGSIIPATTAPQTIQQTCNAIPAAGGAAAYAEGYAQDLWTALQNNTPDGDGELSVQLLKKADGTEVGETLTLVRTHVSDANSTAPHRTLKVNYQVTKTTKDSEDNDVITVIAERYVEVVPDVALRCP